MNSIATLGPEGSHTWQAARKFRPDAEIKVFPSISDVIRAFDGKETDFVMIPVYNTREGEIKEYFHVMETLSNAYWIHNIVLPIHLSLGSLDNTSDLKMILSTGHAFKQCEEYIAKHLPDLPRLIVHDLGEALREIKENNLSDRAVVAAEEVLNKHGFVVRERETAPHNRTRFAVLGREMAPPTGYDATTFITLPLQDRVGLLFDILGEFSTRGVNIVDLHSESDVTTQKLQFFIEVEGHIKDANISDGLARIENHIIQEPGVIKVLGSYPRVDMRVKLIKSFGFIGTGDMSKWFSDRLDSEGYETHLTGRSSAMRPEEMIKKVDVVVVCVPISATAATVKKIGPLLKDGQAMILLAGEAENTLNTALTHTGKGVELMLVHNLWGPRAANMKDKNVSIVRTTKSGALCSEFEAFLYKHGADISTDTPAEHDLLMGVGQKLPTAISVALAMTLDQNRIPPDSIGSHSTLTSLYGILAMSRIHSQSPVTYAEIIAAHGEGRKIVHNFVENLKTVMELGEASSISGLCSVIENSRDYLTDEFLKARMRQALAVDRTLGKVIRS